MEIRITDDGSQTLWSAQYGETYHSSFGAYTESNHVFIEAGLKQLSFETLHIFEMGFGTGLNALLTYQEAHARKLNITYHAIELYPVSPEIISNFEVEPAFTDIFHKLHEKDWNKEIAIAPFFTLKKIQEDLNHFQPDNLYHLVYFDAFSPETQPELWKQEVFQKMYDMLHSGGILTTYCAKGIVRRNMLSCGFKVERLPGPPGKREILRALK